MGHFLQGKSQQRRRGRSSATPPSSMNSSQPLTAEVVAALPPPGLSGPSSLCFSPELAEERYLAFLSSSLRGTSSSSRSSTTAERQLYVLDLNQLHPGCKMNQKLLSPLLKLPNTIVKDQGSVSLEEKLRRERQRLHSGATQFSWTLFENELRILVPLRGNIYVQDGIASTAKQPLKMVYDKNILQEALFGSATAKTFGPIVGRDASAIDPQLSPDGSMVAFVVAGDIYVIGIYTDGSAPSKPIRLTFGGCEESCITHGLADFVAQEEMDRYRGYWWNPDSTGILFTRVNESGVTPYRITHEGRDGSTQDAPYEDHRYPFAGQDNCKVQLAYIQIDRSSVLGETDQRMRADKQDEAVLEYVLETDSSDIMMDQDEEGSACDRVAKRNWAQCMWLDPPREAQEYLARVLWLPDGSACAQWQNRTQSTLVVVRTDVVTGKTNTLLTERSDVWINLNHMMRVLPNPIHPDECFPAKDHSLPTPLPPGSFSFFFASERTGYSHLYLYTVAPGHNGDRAILVRTVSSGDWVVENIVGIDIENDAVYFTGTFGSPLERHLFALPITNLGASDEHGRGEHDTSGTGDAMVDEGKQNGHHGGVRRGLKHVMSAFSGKPSSVRKNSDTSIEFDCVPDPVRLTTEHGMHSIVMDHDCRIFVDTSSDLDRPTSVKLFVLPKTGPFMLVRGRKSPRKHVDALENNSERDVTVAKFLCVLHDSEDKESSLLPSDPVSQEWLSSLPPPELISFPTSDGTETLHAAVYKPDAEVHGPGPYPLVCAVYGGPHVQRVNRSWGQCADMRAQLLRSLGFAVVKCDNRGSARRGLSFESAIRKRLGRLEVLDQVTAVRHLTMRGVADSKRVGIYGWSYGGYLAAMCLCRAPDVFHVAVAGAPVTSWDGYDTHYTERYMGLPSENASGYREAAVFEHVPNMMGRLMIVHGLIDENVHFRHTARLINRLIASGKEYDLLVFPDERHSPRRLRDRIYMEQRISDYFASHLMGTISSSSLGADGSNLSSASSSSIVSSSRGVSTNNKAAIRAMAGHL